MKILAFIELILCASHSSKSLHVLTQLILKTTTHEVRTVVFLILQKMKLRHIEVLSFSQGSERASYPSVSAVEFKKLCDSWSFILVETKTQGNIFALNFFLLWSVLYNCCFADEAIEWLWGEVKVLKFIPFINGRTMVWTWSVFIAHIPS